MTEAKKGGEHTRGTFERRIAILEYLNQERRSTYENLASEFEVSKSTIREDIQALVDARLPVKRDRGRYGGIKIPENFFFFGRPMNTKQVELLERISPQLCGEDFEIMQSILVSYASR